MIPIVEIFGPTIQGEGDGIGRPTVFVRTGGCDFHCLWCCEGSTPIRIKEGSIPAKAVKEGQALLLPDGEVSVKRVLKRRVSSLLRVTLENGASVLCTPDHPLIREDGSVVLAKDVALGTMLLAEA